MERIFKYFEDWLNPLDTLPDQNLPTKSVLKFLWFFVNQSKTVFIIMLILGGLTAFIEAAIFSFVGVIVDLLQEGGFNNIPSSHVWILTGMVFVVLVFRPIVAILTALIEEQVVVPGFFNRVRWQSNQYVIRQSLSYFQNDFAGRIAAKIWQTGQAAGDFMVSLLQIIWFILVFAVSTLVILAGLDFRFVFVVLIWLSCYCLISIKLVPLIRSRARVVADKGSLLSGRLVDIYSNIQTVKLFGDTGTELTGTKNGFEIFLLELRKFTRTLTWMRSLLAILSGIFMTGIGILSFYLWNRSEITSGEVAVVLSLVLRLNLLLGRMMGQMNGLFRNLGTVQDGMDTIAQPISVRDRVNAKKLVVREGNISFDGVRFSYLPREIVINQLSLNIKSGERVGLVGHSGAGKSTLVSLLLRFHDISGGQIVIDGQNISQVTQKSLRQQIGMVTQDTSLMHRSILENISYGAVNTPIESVISAAKKAHAHEFISTLRDQKNRIGYAAHVGERGVKLSGGQRQRIAIARVLLKNAPILILDEATSSLDSEVEIAIQEQLYNLMEGKTVIAIAHRLSTIAAMDRLVVMQSGQIIEQGTHDELIALNGVYAKLWEHQSGGFLVPTRNIW